MKIKSRKFFQRSPDIVAQELLGKIIIRKIDNTVISGKIVETESYFGEDDPASRAYRKKSINFYNKMAGKPGTLLVYMVHNNWLLNFVAHEKKEIGAVLIRAVEPIKGVEVMKKNRGKDDIEILTNGPGKFTQSFKIDKSFDGIDILKDSSMVVVNNKKIFEISCSQRIGVRVDLPSNHRFFISENIFISR